mmetsp:Transcript_22878/g.49499  ORF Transcript_22878/g.49499 Transcript_22878/m.49499 type:complete len:256 (-) Transcript_22878:488-1255(-)
MSIFLPISLGRCKLIRLVKAQIFHSGRIFSNKNVISVVDRVRPRTGRKRNQIKTNVVVFSNFLHRVDIAIESLAWDKITVLVHSGGLSKCNDRWQTTVESYGCDRGQCPSLTVAGNHEAVIFVLVRANGVKARDQIRRGLDGGSSDEKLSVPRPRFATLGIRLRAIVLADIGTAEPEILEPVGCIPCGAAKGQIAASFFLGHHCLIRFFLIKRNFFIVGMCKLAFRIDHRIIRRVLVGKYRQISGHETDTQNPLI